MKIFRPPLITPASQCWTNNIRFSINHDIDDYSLLWSTSWIKSSGGILGHFYSR